MLDQVPWPLRLLPALAALLLSLYILGIIELKYLFLAATFVSLLLLALFLRFPLPFPSLRRGEGGEEGDYKALEIEVRGGKEEVGRELAKVVVDRAHKSNVRFALVSVMEGELRRSLLILSSRDKKVLHIEAEVLKTLLSSLVDGVRVSEAEGEELRVLAASLHRLGLHSRGTLLLSDNSIGERPFRTSRGEGFTLGEILDSPTPQSFQIRSKDLEGHVGIFGSTGSGKSTTLSVIAQRAWEELGIPVILFDWTGEHASLLRERGVSFIERDPMRGEASINPLDIQDVDALVSVAMKALSLTPPQAYMLMRALERRRTNSLRELEEAVDDLPEESKWDREVKRALLRKISMLTRGSYRAFKESSPLETSGIIVVRVDAINNVIARKSYVLFFLSKLFVERSSGVRGPRVLIAIDEAHNVLGGEESPFVEQLFSECRKYGIMLAIATQSPAHVPNGVLLNTNSKVVHALRSSRDKEVIAQTMGLRKELVDMLDKIRPGEALVQTVTSPLPALVQVQLPGQPRGELERLRVGEPVEPHPHVPRTELLDHLGDLRRAPSRSV
ncbi:MAG: ATP-binding protein [Acidilobaceae archaeon]|nr:ATP-binding protein [Acidilobaceae archaeon]